MLASSMVFSCHVRFGYASAFFALHYAVCCSMLRPIIDAAPERRPRSAKRERTLRRRHEPKPQSRSPPSLQRSHAFKRDVMRDDFAAKPLHLRLSPLHACRDTPRVSAGDAAASHARSLFMPR